MAMMAKMRSLAPAFIIAVGGIFVLFMVISDSNVMEILGQRTSVLGSVNGNEITYQQFNALLEQARERQKAQTGQDIDEEFAETFNDQVWDALVTQELVKDQIEKFGIQVSDDEVNDIIFGANPPAFLKNQFVDSTGNFNRELYQQTILKQNKDVLLSIEEQVRQTRLQEKLQNYLFASIVVGEEEIKRKFEEQNTRYSADYALVDINMIPDGEVSVSQDDLKKYYEEHLDDYKIEPQRKLKYVLFSRGASHDDSMLVKNNLTAIVKKAADDTSSFKNYVDIYSELPYSKDSVDVTQVPEELASKLSQAAPGQIIGPAPSFEGYVVYKLLAKVPSKDTYVRASHILVPSGADDNTAKNQAMDIYNKLTAGADFAQVAREKSTDFGSAQKGGDVGWFGKGRMVKEFEDASFNGKIGEIQKPVKTNYGYHIIKVTGRSSEKYVVEKIVNKVKPSASTVDFAYNSATDFAYVADKNDFESEAKLMKYKVQETPPFKEDAFSIPGLGANKNLIEFAFDSDLNDLSEVYHVQNGYIVAKVSEVIKTGFKKFDEIEASLKPLVVREKKYEKAKRIAEQLHKQAASSNNSLQSVVGSVKFSRFDTTGVFTPAQSIPNVGMDYAFVNAVAKTKVNSLSEPVKGSRGYYVIKPTMKTSFDKAAYSVQRNTMRDNMLQEKRSYFLNQWLTQLKENADIEDNRRLFFR